MENRAVAECVRMKKTLLFRHLNSAIRMLSTKYDDTNGAST